MIVAPTVIVTAVVVHSFPPCVFYVGGAAKNGGIYEPRPEAKVKLFCGYRIDYQIKFFDV